MIIAPKIKNPKVTPEGIIQDALVKFLFSRQWYVKETHGNMYQSGFPDLYATHRQYGARWIEVKNPKSYSFTPAQIECFPLLTANGTGIWILGAATESEYQLLWKPANWYIYLMQLNQRTAFHL